MGSLRVTGDFSGRQSLHHPDELDGVPAARLNDYIWRLFSGGSGVPEPGLPCAEPPVTRRPLFEKEGDYGSISEGRTVLHGDAVGPENRPRLAQRFRLGRGPLYRGVAPRASMDSGSGKTGQAERSRGTRREGPHEKRLEFLLGCAEHRGCYDDSGHGWGRRLMCCSLPSMTSSSGPDPSVGGIRRVESHARTACIMQCEFVKRNGGPMMTKTFQAIYSDGVFRPVVPVDLPERTPVEFEPRILPKHPRLLNLP